MLQQSDIEKLEKFSRGTATREEEHYVQSLFADYEESHWLEGQLYSDWNNYLKEHPGEDRKLDHLLGRIHHLIHDREAQKQKTMARRLYRWYSAAAAILLVPVLAGGILWMGNQSGKQVPMAEERVASTLVAPLGSRIAFTLPNGTKGWLNSGTR